MLKFYPSEAFREIHIDAPTKKHYAVSNYGRIISYKEQFHDGRELKGGRADGYRTLDYRIEVDGKKKPSICSSTNWLPACLSRKIPTTKPT